MAKTAIILPSVLNFLSKLKQNNNRDWFTENKEAYSKQLDIMENFADGLLENLKKHDVIETPSGKKSLQRIYRDTRFSKDKTPYKKYWGGGFTRATTQRRGGYYYHIESGNSFIGGGFWAPNTQDLKRMRTEIAFDTAHFRDIIESPIFVETFGSLAGEQLKTMPRGFDADHEAIDLLRYKQFIIRKTFTDDEVLDGTFVEKANEVFKNMRPFLDFMSDALTTDGNGMPIE